MRVLEYSRELIARRSVTPADAGCQEWMIAKLRELGFAIERMPAGGVENFWALHGDDGPLFCFAGHTDVVPPGPLDAWHSDPFVPSIRDGKLYGRGAADMKGSLAAMLVAVEDFLRESPKHRGRIAFLITSDEEGVATHGTRHVVEQLRTRGQRIDYCLVGEPSSEESLADVVKNGRRGSLNASLRILGVQGHVAYPEKAENPIHRALPALQEIVGREWDAGSPDFPPTRLQISNIHSGTGATNVIPGVLELQFNFRFSPASTVEGLQAAVQEILDRYQLRYELDWQFSGPPFYTAPGKLLDAVQTGITEVMGRPAKLSTGGGTSDGRFIARLGGEVVELGPCNASIHKIDEHVALADLERLPQIYLATLRAMFGKGAL
ncbi:succinyl-diaminopimelate desuccinylase [Acidithiobacillus sp. AMEEHan]|uniref:succinyl-diaminopimelate desuccinylase n=1 Tax=Acidithiobacillus sp. AMEEHan TaxID=2994951 RepID=UPI0027E50D05|nr:succinyl-diaminopimelate desuccinylase [Acidithiobacillus sp. AMEEHan]